MRRLLVVHYHFLPVHNVAVKRLLGYMRHLPAFGWQPLVLTREWRDTQLEDASWGLSWEPEIERDSGLTIHRVEAPPRSRLRLPSRDQAGPIRIALRLAHMIAGSYPDEFIGWAKPALRAARALAQSKPVDAVITYCPPETNHIVGSRLARSIGVPWVPFFGDLYGFFLDSHGPRSLGALIRKASRRHWLAPAAACIAVSPYMVEYLAQAYQKRVELVMTGYDPDDFPSERRSLSDRRPFVISHVGSLYPGDQRPEIFFDGLDRFLNSRPQAAASLDVRFVGSKCEAHLNELLENRPSRQVCSVVPKVQSSRALSMVRESDVLLAFNCTKFRDRHGTMSYPTKIFEAFGARRPILAIPPDHDWVDALLARTGAGVAAADAQAVAAVISDWFRAWQSCGQVPYGGKPEVLGEFTQIRQTERLARILDLVSKPAVSSPNFTPNPIQCSNIRGNQ
jgi:hypothetical protein